MVRFLAALSVFAFVISAGAIPAKAQAIGAVSLVNIWAYGKAPSASGWGDLYVADDVMTNHGLRTPSGGALHVRFADDTDLRLGSDAEIVVDRYVYDQNAGLGEFSAEIAKGAFRFITGRMRKEGVRILTPVAVIAIRGTDFIVAVAGDGTTTVQVISGEVEITPRTGGAAVSVPAGETARVAVASQSVETDVGAPTPDVGLDEDGGGAEGAGVGGDSGGGGDSH